MLQSDVERQLMELRARQPPPSERELRVSSVLRHLLNPLSSEEGERERERELRAAVEERKRALREDRTRCERALADAYDAHVAKALSFDSLLLPLQVLHL